MDAKIINRQLSEWVKVFANDYYNKGLISKYINTSFAPIIKKKIHSQFRKWAEKSEEKKHFPKDMLLLIRA